MKKARAEWHGDNLRGDFRGLRQCPPSQRTLHWPEQARLTLPSFTRCAVKCSSTGNCRASVMIFSISRYQQSTPCHLCPMTSTGLPVMRRGAQEELVPKAFKHSTLRARAQMPESVPVSVHARQRECTVLRSAAGRTPHVVTSVTHKPTCKAPTKLREHGSNPDPFTHPPPHAIRHSAHDPPVIRQPITNGSGVQAFKNGVDDPGARVGVVTRTASWWNLVEESTVAHMTGDVNRLHPPSQKGGGLFIERHAISRVQLAKPALATALMRRLHGLTITFCHVNHAPRPTPHGSCGLKTRNSSAPGTLSILA